MITKRKGDRKMKREKVAAYRKMSHEELQGLLMMRRRGGKVAAKKGKGSYDRKAFKKGE